MYDYDDYLDHHPSIPDRELNDDELYLLAAAILIVLGACAFFVGVAVGCFA